LACAELLSEQADEQSRRAVRRFVGSREDGEVTAEIKKESLTDVSVTVTNGYAIALVSCQADEAMRYVQNKFTTGVPGNIRRSPIGSMSSEKFATILQPDQVSALTREVLEQRLLVREEQHPEFFSDKEFELLRTLTDTVLPQNDGASRVPIATQIDLRLSRGEGAGWRYDVLPADAIAYRVALGMLEILLAKSPESGIPGTPYHIGRLLIEVQGQEHDTEHFELSRWFEGFKVDVIRYWLADPRTMKLLNYEGFADNPKMQQSSGDGSLP
jgi:hypothetical protein